jgi:hypothetical protein
MKNENAEILAAAVDRLAVINSIVADLKTEADKLKTTLADAGLDVIEGTLHRAAISHNPGRVTVDWQSIAARFEPSRQLIAAHTSTGAPFAVVRLSARKGA